MFCRCGWNRAKSPVRRASVQAASAVMDCSACRRSREAGMRARWERASCTACAARRSISGASLLSTASAALPISRSRIISRAIPINVAIWWPRVSAPPLGIITRASQLSRFTETSTSFSRPTRSVSERVMQRLLSLRRCPRHAGGRRRCDCLSGSRGAAPRPCTAAPQRGSAGGRRSLSAG